MIKEELSNKSYETSHYLELNSLNDLRKIADRIGIANPADLNKDELLAETVKIGIQRKLICFKTSEIFTADSRATKSDMSTDLSITVEELNLLANLVFLGNYIINGSRLQENQVIKYDAIAEKIYRKVYEVTRKLPGCFATDNELADIRDRAYDSIGEYLEEYERDVFLESLAKRIASLNYPIQENDEKTLSAHFRAEESYIKKLKAQGESFVEIKAPKTDEN